MRCSSGINDWSKSRNIRKLFVCFCARPRLAALGRIKLNSDSEICFFLYFLKLSAGKGFWTNLRRSDPNTHKLAIQYQRSLRRLTKAELDLGFLRKCKESEVYPKFVQWRNINQLRRKKKQHRFHKLLLNEAINKKNANISNLRKVNSQLKAEIFGNTTWMKAKLIIFSINRLL